MAKYRCTVCNYVYDEEKEGKSFSALADDWRCPVCNAAKEMFVLLTGAAAEKPKWDKTVSDIMTEQMAECGVKYVFGLPGTSALGVVEALRKNQDIKFIQVRHEQTAAFMASAYAKLTGHVGACLAVAGPGATNLATGLYDAKLDHAPVLALTGLVKRQMIGPGSFQEIDQHSFFEPISVFNKILMTEDQTTTLVTLAIKHALVERGVSHISIPNDVQKLPYEAEIIPFEGRIPNRAISSSDYLIKQAALAVDMAERPVIISGFGALGQGEELLKLAAKISAPIVTTFRGKGVIDEDNGLYVGSHGTIASTAASELVRKSDLLIVIGSSFSDMTKIPEKKTVQIDIDPMMIAKNYPVEVGLWGNSSELIPKLKEAVKTKRNSSYMAEIRKLKRDWLKQLEREADPAKSPVRPQYIIKVLNDKLPADCVISLDIGENGWWFGRNFFMKKTQKMVMSGYLASMGTGFPGSMAAKLAYPDRQVVCITGDGGFSMVMADFLTAVKNKLPVKIFLFNNRQLGMIMQEQKVEGYQNWQTDLYNCDFAAYARECGGIGIKVSKAGELPAAVDQALASNQPVIVDIETDPRRFI
jgi:thiamine pyrophosphate-dependent acetolactate synthase large subunit-like protein/rubredoxin